MKRCTISETVKGNKQNERNDEWIARSRCSGREREGGEKMEMKFGVNHFRQVNWH